MARSNDNSYKQQQQQQQQHWRRRQHENRDDQNKMYNERSEKRQIAYKPGRSERNHEKFRRNLLIRIFLDLSQ